MYDLEETLLSMKYLQDGCHVLKGFAALKAQKNLALFTFRTRESEE